MTVQDDSQPVPQQTTEPFQTPQAAAPVDSAPTPQSVKINIITVKSSIKDTLMTTLQQLGRNMQDVGDDVDAYLVKISPLLDQAAARAAVDPDVAYRNVQYLWANLWAETGRASLGAIYKDRQLVVSTTLAVLHTAIAMAIAA